MSEIKVPPVEALMILKDMQDIKKKSEELHMQFLMKGATLSYDYGLSIEEITNWIENGKSHV